MRSHLYFVALLLACAPADRRPAREPLLVFGAASLARPLEAALKAFGDSSAPPPRLLIGGSLDLARRVTELRETPDLVVLADEEVMRTLLVPRFVTGYARFARNRLVIAYRHDSRDSINESTWVDVLTRGDVEVARADPARAPVGYRTLLAWQLAERTLALPGLARRLERTAVARNVRANEAEVLALVESGSADFAWVYESSARAAGLRVMRLPSWMDFGDPRDSASYADAGMQIPGSTPSESIPVRGAPISYVLTVPNGAPHRERARKLAAFLLSTDGRRVLQAAGLDVLDTPMVIGAGWLQ